MSTITATTDRRNILAELAAARAENELLRRQAANRILRTRRSAAESKERRANREDRQFADQLRDARDNTSPDPHAAHHRAALAAALKENA